MKPQVPSNGNRRIQWLIAAVAVAGVAILGIFSWKADRPETVGAAPAAVEDVGRPAHTPPPRFTTRSADTETKVPVATADRARACQACEEKNRGGLCVKEMGCEGLSGEDRTLCDNLLSCLKAHPECNEKNPALCYCGDAKGLECVKAPKGPCIQEALAATKTPDLLESARRFFRPEFPSGRASQVSACHLRACKDECVGLQL